MPSSPPLSPLFASFYTPAASAVPALPHPFIRYLPLLRSVRSDIATEILSYRASLSLSLSLSLSVPCVHAKNHEGVRSRSSASGRRCHSRLSVSRGFVTVIRQLDDLMNSN